MGLTFIKHYLQHRLKAKNRHGLHSPFIYKLLDEIVYDFRANIVYTEIEANGRASNLTPGNSPKVNQLIYRLVKHFNPETVLNTGSDTDITLLYMRKAVPHANIYTLASKPNNPNLLNTLHTVDLAYINNTDDQNNGLLYFDQLLPKFNYQSVVIINNIYKHAEARKSWQQIQANPKVMVTVDLFYIGLIFFRPGQAKEHFKLRF